MCSRFLAPIHWPSSVKFETTPPRSVMGAEWIIKFARNFIGSHYLWGSAGATPDSHDGAWYRTGSVGLNADCKSNEQPSVFAATCDVDGHFVCAGNFSRIPMAAIPIPAIEILRTISMCSASCHRTPIGTRISRASPRVSSWEQTSDLTTSAWFGERIADTGVTSIASALSTSCFL